jgi:hypothetical protein
MPSSRCAAREPFYPTFFVRLAREGANRRTWLRTFQGYGYQLPRRTAVTSRLLAVSGGLLPGRFVPSAACCFRVTYQLPRPFPGGDPLPGAFPCRVSRSPLRVAVPSPGPFSGGDPWPGRVSSLAASVGGRFVSLTGSVPVVWGFAVRWVAPLRGVSRLLLSRGVPAPARSLPESGVPGPARSLPESGVPGPARSLPEIRGLGAPLL